MEESKKEKNEEQPDVGTVSVPQLADENAALRFLVQNMEAMACQARIIHARHRSRSGGLSLRENGLR